MGRKYRLDKTLMALQEKVARLDERNIATATALVLAKTLVESESHRRYELDKRVYALEQNVQTTSGKSLAFGSVWTIAITIITIVIGALALILKFLK